LAHGQVRAPASRLHPHPQGGGVVWGKLIMLASRAANYII